MFWNKTKNQHNNIKSTKSKQLTSKISIIMLLICGVLLSSCSLTNKNATEDDISQTTQTSQAAQEDIQTSELGKQENLDSAVLRIYWKSRSDYNPLNTFDYSGKAAFQLMYRSLLTIDKSNVLRNDLTRITTFIPEKNLYQIELIPGITFSDGKLITAEDCAASILQYKENLSKFLDIDNTDISSDQEQDPDENSEPLETKQDDTEQDKTNQDQFIVKPELIEDVQQRHPDLFPVHQSNLEQEYSEYVENDILKQEFKLLDLIKEIKVLDDEKFQIILETEHETDPGVLFALTMPIVPAAGVNTTDIISVTSNRYEYVEFDSGKLLLKAKDADFKLQEIQFLDYKNATVAMGALANDQLDLIFLSEEYYNLYSKQNNTNVISFPGQRYYFITFGHGDIINSPDIKDFMRTVWQVREDLASGFSEDQSTNHLPLQYTDQAISTFGLIATEIPTIPENIINKYSQNNLKLSMIVPKTNLERDWAFSLREKLLNFNIDLKINYVPADNYQAAVAAGNYDLAINWIDLSYPMSLFDTFESISPNIVETFNEDELSLMKDLDSYFYSVDRQIDPKVLTEQGTAYRNLIFEKFDELNILGIGFAPVGVFLSKHVEGSAESHMAEPYLGIEDLWVW